MLKNLKSIFIVEDSEPKKPAAKAKEAPKGGAKKPESTSQPSATPTPARSGKITPKFTNILLGAMDKVNLDGFDYLEYKKSLQSLQKMNMDEATSYQSAYAMAQTMGATPDHLVKTAQHYLDALTKEEIKFESALANQQQTKIGGQREQQKKLLQSVKDKEAQIIKLQKEIEQHKKAAEKINNAIQNAVNNIETTKNDFVASYQNLTKQISTDMENMKKYLK